LSPTIYDIANAANVSKSTVSRVLNNHKNISEDAKSRVLKAIEELNYQPSKIARGLAGGFDAILVISRSTKTTMNNPYFTEVLHIISSYSEEESFDVILQTSQNSEEELKKCVEKIKEKMIKGIIMLSSPSDEELFIELDNYQVPVVVIGRVKGVYKNIYSVDTNNYENSYNLVENLIRLGHKHIACLYSPQDYHVSIDRLSGYVDCMNDFQLTVKEDFVINCGFTLEDSYNATKKLFEENNLPTAIFATDDLKLISLYKLIVENKVSTSDIQVAGYSNSEVIPILFPSMIPIKNPTRELGKKATNILFSIIKGNTVVDRSVIIPAE
jgi:DNA-binding LacI/PurR family transcriptional regulator